MKNRISPLPHSTGSRSAPTRLEVENTGSDWSVKNSGAAHASSIHSTRVAAIDAARKELRIAGGELVVRKRDGRAQESFTFGRKAMAKISAIEGIRLSEEVRGELDARHDLTPQQRRTWILRKYGAKGTAKA